MRNQHQSHPPISSKEKKKTEKAHTYIHKNRVNESYLSFSFSL